MQQNFAAALALVLRSEGGFVDNAADPGGATNLGITRKTLAAWRHISPWWVLPVTAVQALGQTEAAAIYKAQYWDSVRGDDLPPGIDYLLFDEAVNSGPVRAIQDLQRCLGVAADGHFGILTMTALGTNHNRAALINAMCDLRLGFLRRLLTWASFGKGWTNRVAAVRAAALKMASTT